MSQLEIVCHNAKLKQIIYILSQEDEAGTCGDHGCGQPCHHVSGREDGRVGGGI